MLPNMTEITWSFNTLPPVFKTILSDKNLTCSTKGAAHWLKFSASKLPCFQNISDKDF